MGSELGGFAQGNDPVSVPLGSTHDASSSEPGRRVILIIDPDDRLSTLDTTGLRNAGYDVQVVSEAMPSLTEWAPDLIMTPFSPSTDEALARCRQLRSAVPTAVPIVVVTRFDDLYIREQIVRSGATAILVEPLKQSFVLRQVRRLMARSMLHRPRFTR
jgi:DNA-binding response OmpR family regulator